MSPIRINANLSSKEMKLKIEEFAKNNNIPQGQVLEFLFSNYEKNELDKTAKIIDSNDLGLNESEKEELEICLKNNDYKEVLKIGLLQRVRYLNKTQEKESELSEMTENELLNARFKGVAEYRINKVVDKIIIHNNHYCDQPEKQVFITKSMIKKLVGSNQNAIDKYFLDYQQKIDNHNNKYNLNRKTNIKARGLDFSELIGLNNEHNDE